EGGEQRRDLLEASELPIGGDVPDRLRLEACLRKVERDGLERRLVADGLLLVCDDLLRDGEAAKRQLQPAALLAAERLLDRGRRLLLRLRVVVAAVRRDDGGSCAEVELADEVALTEVQVDRALVNRRVRALPFDDPENGARWSLDDGERIRARGAQVRLRCGVVPPRPHVAALRPPQIGDERGALEGLVSEDGTICIVERGFERRRADMAVEDAWIRVVEDGRFDAAVEQGLRLAHEVLVERVLGGDQDRKPVPAPAGPAPLLPERRDRAREADGDRAVEEADVDSQLQRVRGGHAGQLAFDPTALDLAALAGRLPGAVGSEPFG